MYKKNFFLIFAIVFSIPFLSCEPDKEEDPDDCEGCVVVYKPNIYIYPTEETNLDVSLAFPMGGNVIASIPTYNTGWHVSVDINGLIDNQFTYLFYESEQPDIWQRTEGWTIPMDSLEGFFIQNMSNCGFQKNEIDDFIEYWIPRLSDHEYYAIYPQFNDLINEVIELHFSKQPDKVLRLFYLIKGLDTNVGSNLTEPVSACDFIRDGFAVAEWGVILDE